MKRLAALLLVLPLAVGGAGDLAGRVLQRVQDGRERAGLAKLERRADLDRVAEERASRIAALPHSKRLALDESIDVGLRKHEVTGYRTAFVHLDMVRGYHDPASGFLRSWTSYEAAWTKAMNPQIESVGIATHRADDGWVILVAVFLDELRLPTDLHALERAALEAVNRVRAERGLTELDENPALTEIARAHSEDMVRRKYFGHRAPDGRLARDRLVAAGVPYMGLAENIQKNQGFEDPAAAAVESWMESKGHRENILTAKYRQTGMGVAVSDEGKFFFTQLFLTPPDSP